MRQVDELIKQGIEPTEAALTQIVDEVHKKWMVSFNLGRVCDEAQVPDQFWLGYHKAMQEMVELLSEAVLRPKREVFRD